MGKKKEKKPARKHLFIYLFLNILPNSNSYLEADSIIHSRRNLLVGSMAAEEHRDIHFSPTFINKMKLEVKQCD